MCNYAQIGKVSGNLWNIKRSATSGNIATNEHPCPFASQLEDDLPASVLGEQLTLELNPLHVEIDRWVQQFS